MNRTTTAVDRVLEVLLGLALLVGGAWVLAWTQGWLPDGWWSPSRFVLGVPGDVTGAQWWPWALLVGGLVLLAVGLMWLLGHFTSNRVDRLSLPGEPAGGTLLLDGSALADGVAHALEEFPGVAGVRARTVRTRQGVVLDVVATVVRDADLAAVGRACDEVAAHARRSLGRDDVGCRVRLKVPVRDRRAPRVH